MLKGKFKKLLSLLLTFVIVFSCVGCSDDEDGTKKVDPTKTQLYVGIYDGGLDDAPKLHNTAALHKRVQIPMDRHQRYL